MIKKNNIFIIIFMLCQIGAFAQRIDVMPVGAEVWIEPGQTDKQIDDWFRILSENHLGEGRVFIMWNYIEKNIGQWDFSLYDKVFTVAQKYHIKINATLITNRRSVCRGDFYQLHETKLEETEERFDESRTYIKQVVEHFKDHPALESWSVTNEAYHPARPYPMAIEHFRNWLKQKYQTIENLNAQWYTGFKTFSEIIYNEAWDKRVRSWKMPYMDWHIFYRKYLTWWLTEIKNEIKKYDKVHDVQFHSQNVTGNLALKSLEHHSWKYEADYLGVSCHPSWAFALYKKDESSLGVSYVTDLMYNASKSKPFIVTELQGGTNFHSGGLLCQPITPSANEISQWLWTSFGGGAKQVIFWLLNDRQKGWEASEWSMLDFQGRPTGSLIEAGRVAKTITGQKEFFQHAKPYDSKITVIQSLDSELSDAWSTNEDYIGRSDNAQVVSVYGYHKALNEMGIHCRIENLEGFNWESKEHGQFVILPHVTVIPSYIFEKMKTFVGNGNTLLFSGLSRMFDEWTYSWFSKKEKPMSELVGGELKQYELICNDSYDPQDLTIKVNPNLQPEIIWGDPMNWSGNIDKLEGKETLVILWK